MNILRATLVGFVSAVICLGLLFLSYPWSIYYRNFTYGAGITILSYVLLAILVGLIAAIVVGALSFYSRMPALGQCILTGIVLFTSLSAGSVLLGPGGIEIFDTRVAGIFFSEWKFVTFIGTVALPLSILDVVLVWWAVRREHIRRSVTPTTQNQNV